MLFQLHFSSFSFSYINLFFFENRKNIAPTYLLLSSPPPVPSPLPPPPSKPSLIKFRTTPSILFCNEQPTFMISSRLKNKPIPSALPPFLPITPPTPPHSNAKNVRSTLKFNAKYERSTLKFNAKYVRSTPKFNAKICKISVECVEFI